MTMKCKSASHVDAVGSNLAGDLPGIWTVTYLDHGACRNDLGYDGPLYVLTKNGKPGMQLFPDAARALPSQLRAAAATWPSVAIRHKVLTIFRFTKAVLTATAARELADELEAIV